MRREHWQNQKIEKTCLNIAFACERFHQFIYGQSIISETDHKAPAPIVNKKILKDCLLGIQRLLLRRQKYHVTLEHVPGKFMYTFDTLSRAYEKTPCEQQ